ncbi:MAG TPA: hypothetical protein DDZ80_09305, partial [Cyanobacteria bacterium UBA8803]|nr:hypothetical protein [Cyanobacteria bacterium UBA8803]
LPPSPYFQGQLFLSIWVITTVKSQQRHGSWLCILIIDFHPLAFLTPLVALLTPQFQLLLLPSDFGLIESVGELFPQ